MDDQRADRTGSRVTIGQLVLDSLQRQVPITDLPEDERDEFTAQMQDGDELWYFITPEETWNGPVPHCGFEGYVLVRCNEIVKWSLISLS